MSSANEIVHTSARGAALKRHRVRFTKGTGAAPALPPALAAYGVPDGVCSARHNMGKRDRATVDRALAIVGKRLRVAGAFLNSPEMVRDYLKLQLSGEACERFAVSYLDAQHRVIAYECHFSGTLTQCAVYPREIVQSALRHEAAAIVMAHNHPSGNPTPSRADEILTRTLTQALGLVDVRVLDHIVVGGSQTVSLASMGLV